MGAGRFICVALPLVLCLASLGLMLATLLSGVFHTKGLELFTLDLSKATVGASEVKEILENLTDGKLPENLVDDLDNLDFDNIDLGDLDIDDLDLGDLLDIHSRATIVDFLAERQEQRIDVTKLGFAPKYEVNLLGYCAVKDNGKRNCTKADINWASKTLNVDDFNKTGAPSGSKVELSGASKDAIDAFNALNKWAAIGAIIAVILLAAEFVLGIFANCTRVMSCLTWLLAMVTAVIVCAAAALATAEAALIAGLVKGSDGFDEVDNADVDLNGKYLALIWLAAAAAIGASLFWIFTICCCKPDHHKSSSRSRHVDGEKAIGRGGYVPVTDDAAGGFYNQTHQQPAPINMEAAPSYPRGVRSDLAYEPYSHRA